MDIPIKFALSTLGPGTFELCRIFSNLFFFCAVFYVEAIKNKIKFIMNPNRANTYNFQRHSFIVIPFTQRKLYIPIYIYRIDVLSP